MSNAKHRRTGGATKGEHTEEPSHFMWRTAHRDWRVWTVVVLMIAMMLVYVMTDNLSVIPGKGLRRQTPEAITP